ncbi:hypothetical protein PPERSA_03016 [Pseudocohnilembus persalinus]|uniref:Uncharacterized protein n=1 Tax=Pseudocohnilembus persalinus TaxID=266149 RepID=A0A0V0QEY5_PSEPJ|nr:hypothetical protein PPERSA_03016 [Pseudocohnilembus persalinus]|eukprot:KRX00756.1 hypothetical protein PPERSA_03016 [Pseudocohnilembus persalinus]
MNQDQQQRFLSIPNNSKSKIQVEQLEAQKNSLNSEQTSDLNELKEEMSQLFEDQRAKIAKKMLMRCGIENKIYYIKDGFQGYQESKGYYKYPDQYFNFNKGGLILE